MIPLCASAIVPVQSTWGWEFTWDGAPCVAQRVCASPVVPSSAGSAASRSAMKPLSLWTWSPLPTIATPALSYPRYSSFLSPSRRMGSARRCPAYPMIPHTLQHHASRGDRPAEPCAGRDPRPLVDDGPGLDRDPVPQLGILAEEGPDLGDAGPCPPAGHVRGPGGGDQSSPRRDPGPHDGVHHDARRADRQVVHEDRVRDRREGADPHVLPEARGGEQDRVRPDLASLPEGQGALQVRPGAYRAAFPDRDPSPEAHARFDRARPDLVRGREGGLVQPEEVPRIQGVDPHPLRAGRGDLRPRREACEGTWEVVHAGLAEPVDLRADGG